MSKIFVSTIAAVLLVLNNADPMTDIVIDGNFDDWKAVPSRYDPVDLPDGSVYDGNVPDCHDTDHIRVNDIPAHVYNPHADIVEFKYTHDENFLYTYIRTSGEIAKTFVGDVPGRYYIISTVDVDEDVTTGLYSTANYVCINFCRLLAKSGRLLPHQWWL